MSEFPDTELAKRVDRIQNFLRNVIGVEQFQLGYLSYCMSEVNRACQYSAVVYVREVSISRWSLTETLLNQGWKATVQSTIGEDPNLVTHVHHVHDKLPGAVVIFEEVHGTVCTIFLEQTIHF